MKNARNILLILLTLIFGESCAQNNAEELKKLTGKIKFTKSESTKLEQNSFIVLDSISDFLKLNEFEYYIESHSSMRGKSEFNLKKTQKRSELIKLELIKRGIESERLFCKGLGETNRIYLSPTRAGDLKNERIVIIKKEL